MIWFLIRDNDTEAKCRFFVASLGNFKVSVESQLRKSQTYISFLNEKDVKGSQLLEKIVWKFNFIFLVGTQSDSGLDHTLRELSKSITKKYLKKLSFS